ncbi:hypothetical protein D3OALGA1CA_4543 [Olavius algarvensis associated proteobacterium Delta 3]|nr:hypothetical protein D3OALGB2SA_1580 [Olavius algarvensis associated proteobacterium Delta 3]CAB5153062.1 hypothetical protein D3OALGA1CA_4543 [Olavius algarvensis associated proteobacterium Delta 3]
MLDSPGDDRKVTPLAGCFVILTPMTPGVRTPPLEDLPDGG